MIAKGHTTVFIVGHLADISCLIHVLAGIGQRF